MQCFEHFKAGMMREAVAVCSNCGVGRGGGGLVEQDQKTPRTNERTRSILCHTCANVPEAQLQNAGVLHSK
jgi:hypothetical protein